jgi:hypothetical protein
VTMTNGSSVKGTGGRRASKFTPQAIEKIKKLVAQGVTRDEVANLLDVTLGSLQVTCSKLGISLRRTVKNGAARHRVNGNGRSVPTPGSVGLVHERKQNTEEVSQTTVDTAPLTKFAVTIRHRDKEVTSDIPITSRAIEVLALEAMLRDLGIGKLVGQVLAGAVKKDMIQEILRDEVPPSSSMSDSTIMKSPIH